jgi:hypothetical protein
MLFRGFCLKPSPTSLLQRILPSARLRHIASSFFELASSALTNTRSPETIGVPAPGPGRAVVQRTFVSASNLAGRSFASLAPLRCGPRHCRHSVAELPPASAARAGVAAAVVRNRARPRTATPGRLWVMEFVPRSMVAAFAAAGPCADAAVRPYPAAGCGVVRACPRTGRGKSCTIPPAVK